MDNGRRTGLFFALEGLDGCGKSTQLALLAQALAARGVPVLATREPSDGPYGRRIRAMLSRRSELSPQEELELFHADRRDHAERVIRPGLAAGKVVLCDRYFLSTAAYQGARGFDPEAILRANESFAPIPDAIFLLELGVDEALRRITESRGEAPNDFERREGLAKVAQVLAALDRPYLVRVAAGRPKEAVHRDLLGLVLARLEGSDGDAR